MKKVVKTIIVLTITLVMICSSLINTTAEKTDGASTQTIYQNDTKNIVFSQDNQTRSLKVTLVSDHVVWEDIGCWDGCSWKPIFNHPKGIILVGDEIFSSTGSITLKWMSTDTIIGSWIFIDQLNQMYDIQNSETYKENGRSQVVTPEWTYNGDGGVVCSVAVSGDGNYIACKTSYNLRLFAKASSSPLWSKSLGNNLGYVALSSDGSYVAVTAYNEVRLYNRQGTQLWSKTIGDFATSISMSSDGEYFAVGSDDNKVYLFDKDSSTPLWTYTAGGDVNSVAVDDDGSRLVAGSSDNKMYYFQRSSSTPVWSYTSTQGWFDKESVAISASGQVIIAGDTGGYVYMWYVPAGSTPRDHYSTGSSINCLAIGNYFATACSGINLYQFVLNPLFIARWYTYEGSSSPYNEVCLSLNGYPPIGACDSSDNNIRCPYLWNYQTNNRVLSISQSESGEQVAGGGTDTKLYFFDLNTITFETNPAAGGTITFDDDEYRNTNITKRPDGTYSITATPASDDYRFDHWSATGGISISNPNSQSTTATISNDGTVKAWFKVKIIFHTNPSSGGTITCAGVTYDDGEYVYKSSGTYSVTANPAAYYYFDHWSSEGGVTVDNQYSQTTTITAADVGTVTAYFISSLHTITFYTDPSDRGYITFDGSTYYNGDQTSKPSGEYDVTAHPIVGYEFDHWTSTGGVGVPNEYVQTTTATVTATGTLKAWFKENHPPVLSKYDSWSDGVDPDSGDTGTTFHFKVHYSDQDGDSPGIKNVVIDSSSYQMGGSGYNSDYSFDKTGFDVGYHTYYFYFEDSYGFSARLPESGTWSFHVKAPISLGLLDVAYMGNGVVAGGQQDGTDAYFCRTDASGNILWSNTWHSSDGSTKIYGVTKKDDTIVYAVGDIYSNDSYISRGFVLKINAQTGTVLISKIFELNKQPYRIHDIAYYQGYLFLVGSFDRDTGGDQDDSLLFIKLNEGLELQWEKHYIYYDQYGEAGYSWGETICIVNGIGYLGGWLFYGSFDLQACVASINLNDGSLNYFKEYLFVWMPERGYGLTYNSNNGCLYLVGDEMGTYGYSRIKWWRIRPSDGYYYDFDRWDDEFGDYDCYARDIIYNPHNDRLYLIGFTDKYGGGFDSILLKSKPLPEEVELMQSWTWGGAANDCGYAIDIDENGYLYVVGGTNSYSTGLQAFLLKYDMNGNIIWQKVWSGDSEPPETTITEGPSGEIDYTDVSFTFTGTDDQSSTLKYSYYLQGYDSGWSEYSIDTTASYTNLQDQHTYTFKVIAKDMAGNEDLSPATRTFNINLGPCCFAPGTQITMYDGSTKAIENIHVGDTILSDSGLPWIVAFLGSPTHAVYEINNNLIQVTKDHAFYIKKPGDIIGWGAIDPEAAYRHSKLPNEVMQLEIGDQIWTLTDYEPGSYMVNGWTTVTSITVHPNPIQTYNIISLCGVRTFYANSLCVYEEYNPWLDWEDPPTACYTWTDVDGQGSGTLISFDASCSTGAHPLIRCDWDWTADGTYDYTDTDPYCTHNYGDTLAHICKVKVTDDLDQSDTILYTIKAEWNIPPLEPTEPYPETSKNNVDIHTYLSWEGGDPNPDDTVTYDVYFGTTSQPPRVSHNQIGTVYAPEILEYDTCYYWKIIATDIKNSSTAGPLWSFTTEEENQPPYQPSCLDPGNSSAQVSVDTFLSWNGGDPNTYDAVTYDVYFEENDPTPDHLVSFNQSINSFNPGKLNYSTHYYWRIISHDTHGVFTASPIWKFSTTNIWYSVTDLGRFREAHNMSYAYGLNTHGHVVGSSEGFDDRTGFFLDNGTFSDLPSLGGFLTDAKAINDQGSVVGSSQNSEGNTHAVVWKNHDLIIDLGLFSGIKDNSYAYDINARDQVVGSAGGIQQGLQEENTMTMTENTDVQSLGLHQINGGGSIEIEQNSSGEHQFVPLHAFLWNDTNSNNVSDPGEMLDLGTLPDDVLSMARSINDNGVIVGESWPSIATGGDQRYYHAFIWNTIDGMSPLNVLSGDTYGKAFHINNENHVVGCSGTTMTETHAVLWENTVPILLNDLGGSYSCAYSLNDNGDIVGTSAVENNSAEHAVVWTQGIIQDLNTVILSNSGWELKEAYDNNNDGQIVGYGTTENTAHGFLLTPDISVANAPVLFSSTHPNENQWYRTNDPSLCWSVPFDETGIVGYSYLLDYSPDSLPDTIIDTTDTTQSYSGLLEGIWWFHVRAKDTAQNWGPADHYCIKIDTNAPSSPLISSPTHPSEDQWFTNNDPVFTWNEPNDISGIQGYSYILDQSSSTIPDQSIDTTSNTISYTDGADGIWYFHIRAEDNAGFWGATDHYRIKIDTTGPDAPIIASSTHPDENQWYISDDPQFTWTPPNDPSGISGYSIILDHSSSTIPDTSIDTTATSKSYSSIAGGTWYFHVRTRDTVGNWGLTDHYRVQIITIVWTSPTGYNDPESAWVNEQSAYDGNTLSKTTCQINQFGWVWTPFLELTLSSPKTCNNIRFYAWYDADHCDQIDVDVYTNSAWVHVYQGSYLGYVWVEKAVNQEEVTAVRVRFEVQRWVLSAVQADLHEFQFDTTGPARPTISSSTHPNENQWYANNDPMFSWITIVLPPGIAGYSYLLDHSSSTVPDRIVDTTATTKNYTDVADGTWYFHVRAMDNAGYWGPADDYRVKIDVTPPSAPVITSPTHPNQNLWYGDNDPVFSVTVSPDTSGIAGYSSVLDHSSSTIPDTTIDTTSPTFFCYDLSDGVWYFHVRAIDNAGNCGSASHYRVQIFATVWTSPTGYYDPESAWLDEPLAYDGNVNTKADCEITQFGWVWTPFLELTVSSPISCNNIRFWAWYDVDHCDQIDVDVYSGTTWNHVYQGSFNGYVWVVKPVNLDNVTRARVRFHVQRWVSSAVQADLHEFQFDITGPPAPVISSSTHPNENQWYTNTNPLFTWTVPSDVSGIAGYSYSLDHYPTTVPDRVVDTTGTSAVYVGLGGGVWYFHVHAKDNAGYWGPADHYRVQIFVAGWVSPTGFNDPYSGWVDEPLAYDGDTNTKASSNPITEYGWVWTPVVELTLPSAILSNKVRFWAWYDASHCDQINIDVYSGSSWQDVYLGSYTGYTWVEKTFSERSVTKARVSFRVQRWIASPVEADLHEFQFYHSSI